jgi:epoxyqueuosine reductase
LRYNLFKEPFNLNSTQAIKEQAFRLGFSLAGISPPDPLPHTDVFEAWLQQGRHGEMAYLETLRSRQCRAQPRQLMPECRSILALGIPYPVPVALDAGDLPDTPLLGKIAAYARGKDYHDFLPGRLQDLVRFIESRLGHAVLNRWYTDTGPLLERELAQRAGLGWIGKNTCLINPGKGSYLLLAEILLDVELEPDPPFTQDRCGSCTRCITACPTGCILPNRTLDAQRCVSYLTIEFKGSIPVELRPRMGRWIFGCDICQQACPWNRFAIAEADAEFLSPVNSSMVDLLNELRLTEDEFNHKYHHSPLKRPKRRGYLRNIAVALGNSRCEEAVPALSRALLEDHESLVRAHAAWALGQIGGDTARHSLEKAAGGERDSLVSVEIQGALADL